MLKLPNFTLSLVVETNASAVAVGEVLNQEGHPLEFFNKKMGPRLQASSMYVCEMYAHRSNQEMTSIFNRLQASSC